MSEPGLFGRLFSRRADQASATSAPAPDPASPSWEPPDLFGLTLTELRCALACYNLVDEVVRSRGGHSGERDRMAHIYAGGALARAARRLAERYGREAAREMAP